MSGIEQPENSTAKLYNSNPDAFSPEEFERVSKSFTDTIRLENFTNLGFQLNFTFFLPQFPVNVDTLQVNQVPLLNMSFAEIVDGVPKVVIGINGAKAYREEAEIGYGFEQYDELLIGLIKHELEHAKTYLEDKKTVHGLIEEGKPFITYPHQNNFIPAGYIVPSFIEEGPSILNEQFQTIKDINITSRGRNYPTINSLFENDSNFDWKEFLLMNVLMPNNARNILTPSQEYTLWEIINISILEKLNPGFVNEIAKLEFDIEDKNNFSIIDLLRENHIDTYEYYTQSIRKLRDAIISANEFDEDGSMGGISLEYRNFYGEQDPQARIENAKHIYSNQNKFGSVVIQNLKDLIGDIDDQYELLSFIEIIKSVHSTLSIKVNQSSEEIKDRGYYKK